MSIYDDMADLARRGEPAVLCIVATTRGSVPRHAGAKMLVLADGSIRGSVGGGELESRTVEAALEVMRRGGARLLRFALQNPDAGDPGVCGGEVEIFLDPITAKPTLLVVGAGHVGRALVHLGSWLGFRVVLSDDRAEQCTEDVCPGADEYICCSVADLAQRVRIDGTTWIVMPTRGISVDVEGLPLLLEKPFAYLGVIGSRRRWLAARKSLEERGIPPEALDRVRSPMGLEIEAETPEEIALSILAEILMLRHGGTGAPMSRSAD